MAFAGCSSLQLIELPASVRIYRGTPLQSEIDFPVPVSVTEDWSSDGFATGCDQYLKDETE
jgi:hypothetical protein